MKLLNYIVRFRKDESGAVTVDWVVLTAALVALAVGIGIFIVEGLEETATSIGTNIGNQGFQDGIAEPISLN